MYGSFLNADINDRPEVNKKLKYGGPGMSCTYEDVKRTGIQLICYEAERSIKLADSFATKDDERHDRALTYPTENLNASWSTLIFVPLPKSVGAGFRYITALEGNTNPRYVKKEANCVVRPMSSSPNPKQNIKYGFLVVYTFKKTTGRTEYVLREGLREVIRDKTGRPSGSFV